MEFQSENEEEMLREQRRRERIERMREEKQRAIEREQRIKKYAPYAGGIFVIGIMIIIGAQFIGADSKKARESNAVETIEHAVTTEQSMVSTSEKIENLDKTEEEMQDETLESLSEKSKQLAAEKVMEAVCQVTTIEEPNVPAAAPATTESAATYTAHMTEQTNGISDEIISERVIFIDRASGDILAQKGYQERMNPASMTKVLTLLVAAEQVEDLDDTFTITYDITDYCFANGCSNAGFEVDEEVTVRDMMYGTILPSGADAALGLAYYVSGSQEAFVELMNEKLEELGLSETSHFTNCMGIYAEDHYSTVYDIAMIMEAAMDNEICREVLNARTYTTSATTQHPEGMILSNWFLRRIEDKDTGGEMIGGKTGYVVQSGSCAVSAGRDEQGNEYICATQGSSSSWRCIYDHVALYDRYVKRGTTDEGQ